MRKICLDASMRTLFQPVSLDDAYARWLPVQSMLSIATFRLMEEYAPSMLIVALSLRKRFGSLPVNFLYEAFSCGHTLNFSPLP